MPDLAGHILRIFVRLDLDDFRMAFHARGGVDVQAAESASEGLVLIDGQMLVPKEDHQMAHQGRVDLVELPSTERLAQIDTENLRTDGRSEWTELYRLRFQAVVGHRSFSGSKRLRSFCANGATFEAYRRAYRPLISSRL
jgi:hypothetical protein